jgi:hypothetical protein
VDAAALATPGFSPQGAVYSAPQTVYLFANILPLTGITIHYTDNGTAPTCSSTQFQSTTGIPVSTTKTIKAVNCRSGVMSSVASATYTINAAKVSTPSFLPQCTATHCAKVQMSCATASADIYYTNDLSNPVCYQGSKYTAGTTGVSIPGTGSTTIKAIACKSGMQNSDVNSFTASGTMCGTCGH